MEKLKDIDLGYLIGFFVGDGYAFYNKKDRHYVVEFYFNSERDNIPAKQIKSIIKGLGLKYFIIVDKRFKSFRLKVNSKIFMNFIIKNVDNLKKMNILSRNFKLGFVSGIVDSDGWVSNGEICISQKDIEIIKILEKIIENLGISTRKSWKRNPKSSVGLWRLSISTKFKYLQHNSCKIKQQYGCSP